MLKRTFRLTCWGAGYLLLGGMLAACMNQPSASTDGAPFELKDGERSTFEGLGSPGRLTASERVTYAADRQYVRNLAPAGATVSLNHADARQHRFVMMRLKLAGKTPQTSPQLFKRVEALRAAHLAMGLPEGSLYTERKALDTETTSNGWTNQHYLVSVAILNNSLEALATASSKDSINYGYVDIGLWDSNGTPVGDMPYAESYGNMPYANVAAAAPLTEEQLQLDFDGDSLMMEESVEYGFRETYVTSPAADTADPNTVSSASLKNSSSVTAANRPNKIAFSTATITAPADRPTDSDTYISVCLNRTWTQDCDYDLTASTQALKIPLQGSIRISSTDYIFNQSQIEAYKQGARSSGQIRLTLTNVGGGCNVDKNQSMEMGMRTFWQNTTLSADLKTLSWNLTGANSALFDESCRQVQDRVILAMHLMLPWRYAPNGSMGFGNAYISNATSTSEIATIRVTNSCLAAGSEIELADGRTVPIESVQIGDQIRNPYSKSGSALTVTDTAKGFELSPMVHIEDEGGRSLLMTEMHPMPVKDRGMVLARHLRAGDSVLTSQGASRLVRVTREKYGGSVFNLKVGTDAEIQKLGEDQTVIYANGFLVGDGQIQSKYELRELSQVAKRTQLPGRWRQDYLGSAHRSTSL